MARANAMPATDPERTTVVGADMRDPHAVLDHPHTRRLIDFDRPVGLLFVAVLHFLPDSVHPHQIVRTCRDALEPGSCMAISHVDNETAPERAALLETGVRKHLRGRSGP